MGDLKAPFPWFGGKSRAADLVWQRFGRVANYVEPFFGSGAVLLGSPYGAANVETVNDLDGLLCNAWRAMKADPDGLAEVCDWPVSECDLTARHLRLVAAREELTERLIADPDFFDLRLAGWWIWGACCWIGSGWCGGGGPWVVEEGRVVKGAGRGVNRQLPNMTTGCGVHVGRGQRAQHIEAHMRALSARMDRARIACGPWQRVTTRSVIHINNTTPVGVFLDPPYSADLHAVTYATEVGDASADVRAWCAEHGGDRRLRIGVCGYGSEHAALEAHGWTCAPVVGGSARGGYGSQGDGRGRDNRHQERIWFSPHCLSALQGSLL